MSLFGVRVAARTFKVPPPIACKRCDRIRTAPAASLHLFWHPGCTPEHAEVEGERVRTMALAMHAAENHEDLDA